MMAKYAYRQSCGIGIAIRCSVYKVCSFAVYFIFDNDVLTGQAAGERVQVTDGPRL